MRLVVAEKPSVARDLASALGKHRKEQGALRGEGWTVTWALGHLVELAMPDAYGEQYKRWKLDSLPILPERFQTKVNPKTRDQFSVVKRLMKESGVSEIVNACDAGREGELIFAYLYELAGTRKPVKRLWISSLTPEAIRTGFESLRPGEQLQPLEHAARSRSEADWVVGMNATRAYSTKFGRPGNVLSVGRVQTPTLRLLADREREIENFKPEKFWTVHARFRREQSGERYTYDGAWFKGQQNCLPDREQAEALAEKVKGQTGTVAKVDKRQKTERPPLLYDLTELQRNANARYNFTADRTLKSAQKLYEEHKLVTYPRTSSRYLSSDMVGGLVQRVAVGTALPELATFSERLLALPKLPVNKRIVDDGKVTDHHAIIPTTKKATGQLPPDEAKVYDLVLRRFLAVFFPDARFEETGVTTEVAGETFLSKGRVVLEAGWRELYPDGVGGKKEREPPVLPGLLERGQEWAVVKAGAKEGETKPPPRYSESALLGAMETAGKFVEDEELRQQMKDSGLGTPATRAATIERLIKVGYAERQKKALVPTAKGRDLISLLGESTLTLPELTARWERRLAGMERGEESREEFMSDIRRFATRLVEHVRTLEGEKLAPPANAGGGKGRGKGTGEPLGECPKCGSPVVETKKSYGCSDWKTGCKFAIWKTVAGKRLTANQAKQLLQKGKTPQLKGFKSKAGKPFAAALRLDGDHRVTLDFESEDSGSKREIS